MAWVGDDEASWLRGVLAAFSGDWEDRHGRNALDWIRTGDFDVRMLSRMSCEMRLSSLALSPLRVSAARPGDMEATEACEAAETHGIVTGVTGAVTVVQNDVSLSAGTGSSGKGGRQSMLEGGEVDCNRSTRDGAVRCDIPAAMRIVVQSALGLYTREGACSPGMPTRLWLNPQFCR